MSVKVRHAGDKDIIVGRSGGSALFTPTGAGPSFPPYGTLINTLYYYELPVAQGGNVVTYYTVNYPNNTVTVDELADGLGGVFIDWLNKRDLAYKVYGTIFTSFYGRTTYVNIAGNDYASGSISGDAAHDGSGGYTELNQTYSYTPNGTYITYVASTHNGGSLEVPTGSGNYYNNGTYDGYDYYHDGAGGYYNQDAGSFMPFSYGYVYTSTNNQTEIPSGSMFYYDNGTTSDNVADGFGGYTGATGGSYYSYGTFVRNSIYYDTGSSVEVPSGSGNYFYPQWYGDKWYWDGSGGYYSNTSSYYYDYGTYITNDGTYNYYWDGVGGFYQV